MSTINLMSVQY